MDFQTSLQQQHETVGRFIAVLEREQTLLATTPVDAEALASVTEDKTACATELEQLDHARQQIVAARGYSTDRDGAEQLAAASGCLSLWQAFIERVEQAQTLNQSNGLAIGNRLVYAQEALSFLGRDTGDGLYGPDGQTSGVSGRNLHGSV